MKILVTGIRGFTGSPLARTFQEFDSGIASVGDLIVLQDPWEGITFNRYYRGQAQWLTVPPIDSHEVHRIDLVIREMRQPGAMIPALRAILNTLASGQHVWLVGSIPIERSKDAPPGPTPLPPPPSEMLTGWWGDRIYIGGTNRLQRFYWITRSKERLRQLLRLDR